MNIDLQRKIDVIAGALICRILSLLPGKQQKIIHNPKKIMVILLSEMGSLVLARPMFDKLKNRYPEAEIFGLLFEQNRIILELIDAIPQKNILTVSNQSLMKLILSSLRVLIQMNRIKVDIVIDCELFSRISSIFSFFSRANIKVGFHRHKLEGLYRGDFINRPVLYNPYNHISHQFVTLAEAIESEGMPRVKRVIIDKPTEQTLIQFSPEEIDRFQKQFNTDFPDTLKKKLILIYPSGGLLPIRAWPLDKYCRLAEQLIGKGYSVGVIGVGSDKQLAQKIQLHCNHKACIDLTGYTKTVRELMIIFHFSALLITNDGGPGHFAAMTPIPSIIFYGPETPVLYGPISNNAYIFYRTLSCSPCLTAYNHRNSPCDGNNQCLQGIQVEDVMKKAQEILEM